MTSPPTVDAIRAVVRAELDRHRAALVAELRATSPAGVPERRGPGEFPRCPRPGCSRIAVSQHCLDHGDIV